MTLSVVVKHLPGKHDQKLHAPKRVAPSSKVMLNPELQEAVLSRQLARWTPEQLDRAAQGMKDLVDGSPVCMRVTNTAMISILQSGKFLNQHEAGTSEGLFDPELRQSVENEAFDPSWTEPSEFPLYGYMDTTANGLSPNVWYGPIKVAFKDSVKGRTTITYDDSLDGLEGGRVAPSRLDDIKSQSIGLKIPQFLPELGYGLSADYVEAQIHGGLTLNDIDRVYMKKGFSHFNPELLELLDAKGVPYKLLESYAALDGIE